MIPRPAECVEHLRELAADPDEVELVAALVHGSRATFTIAEAAKLLSVSSKYLYAAAAATGEVAPGVVALRTGDRLTVAAHQLRARIGLPDPHAPPTVSTATVAGTRISPRLLARIADLASFAALMRLETAGVVKLPERKWSVSK